MVAHYQKGYTHNKSNDDNDDDNDDVNDNNDNLLAIVARVKAAWQIFVFLLIKKFCLN